MKNEPEIWQAWGEMRIFIQTFCPYLAKQEERYYTERPSYRQKYATRRDIEHIAYKTGLKYLYQNSGQRRTFVNAVMNIQDT